MHGPAPYPYTRLRRMSRGEATRRTRLARRLDLGDLDRAASAAHALFDVAPVLRPEPVGICPSAMVDRVVPERCAAIIVAAPADPLHRRFVLELSSASARSLVDRLLGVTAVHVEAPLSQGEVGVLLYAAARLVADAAGGALQVLGVLTTRMALTRALGSGDLAFWPIHFVLAGTPGVARIWLSDESLSEDPIVRPPSALAALSLDLRLFRGRVRILGRELVTLAPGDAIVLDEATGADEVFGEVAGSRRTLLRCQLDGDRVVVLEIIPGREAGTVGAAPARPSDSPVGAAPARPSDSPVGAAPARPSDSPGETMSEAEVHQGLERAGDAEIELTVDVARLRLRLSDLARLRPGEVLGTAVDVGAHVRLRAGDLDVAKGELVDIEGKLGVLVTAVFPTAKAGDQ